MTQPFTGGSLYIFVCFTSSTPSIHLGGSFLVTPMAASGSRLIPDTRAIRSSANLKTQKTNYSIKNISCNNSTCWWWRTTLCILSYSNHEQQYLVKLLMWLQIAEWSHPIQNQEKERKTEVTESEPRKISSVFASTPTNNSLLWNENDNYGTAEIQLLKWNLKCVLSLCVYV